jgi:hypothetical protein
VSPGAPAGGEAEGEGGVVIGCSWDKVAGVLPETPFRKPDFHGF